MKYPIIYCENFGLMFLHVQGSSPGFEFQGEAENDFGQRGEKTARRVRLTEGREVWYKKKGRGKISELLFKDLFLSLM
jgi:hypothetical protein